MKRHNWPLALCQAAIFLGVLLICYEWVGPSCSASALVLLFVIVPMTAANQLALKWPRWRVLLRLGVPLAGVGAAMALLAWETSPSVMFRKYVADPVPPSVRIVQGKLFQIGSDPAVYLHFKIAPSDLDTILTKHELPLEANGQLRDVWGPGVPSWWQPKSLPGLQSGARRGPSYSIGVYTDANRTEVFLKLVEP